ncbi:DNA-processing protein DprA [Cohnella terricola]|uniref:DNA-protecting protein DprA n=1 Tax=Cohnella terricola TaxID=1289167 RepID=A0A559JCR4_9BACL|nr:DNA-processing protein DprA [Cohnella terricola]TVX97675.1 DNA-protecting protein DprA [Cohnella terricola]
MTDRRKNGDSESVRAVTKVEALSTGISREVLIALHETEGVGRVTIAKALLHGAGQRPGSLRHSADFRAGDWRERGMTPRQAAAVEHNMRPESAERRRIRHAAGKMKIVTYLDDEYPELLYQISDPPWVLYYRGRLELLRNPAIAIVGTRVATAYGRNAAGTLAEGCGSRMTVVSGLARGIDAAAHSGALRTEYGTIAVVAGGVDAIYPPENKALYAEMADRGLIVSESPPDTILRPGLFPLRNRIIAGLSFGVIVVEAARRSGALITADLALDYNRDVFVVPGQVSSPKSLGALEYFRKGAHPALDANDIFQAYHHRLPAFSSREKDDKDTGKKEMTENVVLSADELRIYQFILDQPCSVDELAVRSGMTFGLLHSVLLSLLIKRRIQQQPGSVYHVL